MARVEKRFVLEMERRASFARATQVTGSLPGARMREAQAKPICRARGLLKTKSAGGLEAVRAAVIRETTGIVGGNSGRFRMATNGESPSMGAPLGCCRGTQGNSETRFKK